MKEELKMKKFASIILAAVIGSALTIGTFLLIDRQGDGAVRIEHISGTPAVGAAYTVNKDGEMVPLEFTGIAKGVMPAVVHIKSTQLQQVQNQQYRDFFNDDMFRRFFGPDFRYESPQPQQRGPQARIGAGSGVIISQDGYIVTNNHVINLADDIEVTLNDNRIFKAKVIGTDPSTDLALIQIQGSDLPYLPLANSDEVEVGEWVLAVGNPFNLNSTVTAGIVSAKARNINILQDQSAIESFIQTDAAINPGNSGGALVDMKGGLIGINTAIASPTGAYAGYGFAVPSNIVNKVVEDLITYGMVQRGYLGIMIRNVDGNLAAEKDLSKTVGVYVDSITRNSAAEEAGIMEEDVIMEVDGNPVKSTAELLEYIGRQRPGDKVNLTVDRKGEEIKFLVTLRNQDGVAGISSRTETVDVLDVLGIELEEIEKETARRLNIDAGLRITKIMPGKLKRQTDVRAGFIITHVDNKEVNKVEEFVKILEGREDGVMITGVYENYPGRYYYAFGL
jgi:Do/DeqQ family serine protease